MGVGLDGHGTRGDRDLDDKIVHAEVEGKNCILSSREADI